MNQKTYHYFYKEGVTYFDVIEVEEEEVDINTPPLTHNCGYPLGETLADAKVGKFVLLTALQEAFYLVNQTASLDEIWNMELNPPPVIPEPTLEELKLAKTAEIEAYDVSDAVNGFYYIYEGEQRETWLDKVTRGALKDKLERELAIGKTTTILALDNIVFEAPISDAMNMLIDLSFYADDAYIVTVNSKSIVSKLQEKQDVKDFNFKILYPPKRVYNLDELLSTT